MAKRRISMPSRGYFMRMLQSNYEQLKLNMIEIFSKQKYLCVTCDVWSSRAQSYFGVTVHYLNESFERKSYGLAFRPLYERQTHEELAKAMQTIFDDFKIDKSKITNVVTDGCSAFTKSFKRFGKEDPHTSSETVENVIANEDEEEDDQMRFIQNENGELFVSNIITFAPSEIQIEVNEADDSSGDEFFSNTDETNGEDNLLTDLLRNIPTERSNTDVPPRIELPEQRRCVSHSLNLLAADFDKSLSTQAKSALVPAANKLHSLWVFTHRSAYAKTLCKEGLGCILQVPCVTRWNSKYDAVSKACREDIKPKINVLISTIKEKIARAAHLQALTVMDWAILEQYIAVMKPIAISLDRLQGDKTCCQGFIVPTLMSMRYRISILDGSSLLQVFKTTALNVIDKRFGRYMGVNDVNRELILASVSHPQFKTTFLEDSDHKRRARDMLLQACSAMTSVEDDNDEGTNVNTDENDENDDFFIRFTHTDTRRESYYSFIESEVSRYLNDRRTEVKMLNEYPNIKNIFIRFNTTLSSSGPVERMFNQTKLIFRPQRNRISPENFERSIIVKMNYSLTENK